MRKRAVCSFKVSTAHETDGYILRSECSEALPGLGATRWDSAGDWTGLHKELSEAPLSLGGSNTGPPGPPRPTGPTGDGRVQTSLGEKDLAARPVRPALWLLPVAFLRCRVMFYTSRLSSECRMKGLLEVVAAMVFFACLLHDGVSQDTMGLGVGFETSHPPDAIV